MIEFIAILAHMIPEIVGAALLIGVLWWVQRKISDSDKWKGP